MRKTSSTMEVRPSTLRELSVIYGVNRYTFRKWLKPFSKDIGERIGNYYSIPQVIIIFKKLGLPSTVKIEDYDET